VQAGKRRWWANCIWDALGIPAMLHRDVRIDACCGCCNRPRGGTLSVAQGWRLAQEWYGDRLSPDWRAKTVSEAEAAFAGIGLLGEFWKLAG
jgi:hypothetical protein